MVSQQSTRHEVALGRISVEHLFFLLRRLTFLSRSAVFLFSPSQVFAPCFYLSVPHVWTYLWVQSTEHSVPQDAIKYRKLLKGMIQKAVCRIATLSSRANAPWLHFDAADGFCVDTDDRRDKVEVCVRQMRRA